tara:strand:+ start:449 stop:571 length:123 start_codon:yes stop_codon:yes gene_type:complete
MKRFLHLSLTANKIDKDKEWERLLFEAEVRKSNRKVNEIK